MENAVQYRHYIIINILPANNEERAALQYDDGIDSKKRTETDND